MLVYGHQEYDERLARLCELLSHQVARTRADDLDQLRTLMIQAGQVEQGVEDSSGPEVDREIKGLARDVTARAAFLFWRCLARQQKLRPGALLAGRGDLAEIRATLEALGRAELPVVNLKIPEGFAHYGLFPEQYCVSARQWGRAHEGVWPKQVAIVGVRSIGTTLSAVVAAVLADAGWQVTRLTVRPGGHPFARVVSLGSTQLRGVSSAVIVDEGPGLSGSSMAATAGAVAAAGVKDISFLPGHGGAPGSAASAETRRWWAETPRYIARLEDLRWSGLSLAESLVARVEDRDAAAGQIPGKDGKLADLSGGAWRQRAFSKVSEWPACCARFERLKFLGDSSPGNSVLWKFAGLGCLWQGGKTAVERIGEELAPRVEQGLVPAPLQAFRGFVAMPWVRGRRLRRSEASRPALARQLGQYLLRASGPDLSGSEAAAAHARLTAMLYANTKEALGEESAECCRRQAEGIGGRELRGTYGDGRMAPHEWVETPGGGLVKTDCASHAFDHTLIGKQPLMWDVAGVLVEWGLGMDRAVPLMFELARGGIHMRAEELRFYRMAYASFRMGMTALCAGQLPSGEECGRLESATEFYRQSLASAIGEQTGGAAAGSK